MLTALLKKRCPADVSLAISVAVGFLSYYFFMYKGLLMRFAPLVALPSLLLFLYAHVTFARHTRRAPTRGEALSFALVFVCNVFLAVCSLAGLVRYSARAHLIGSAKMSLVLFLLFAVIALGEGFFLVRFVGVSHVARRFAWRKNLPFLVMGVLLVVLNLGTLTLLPRWDAMAYFTAYSAKLPVSLVRASKMRLADHASYPVSLIYVFLIMLTDSPLLAGHLAALLLLVAGTYLFYRIAKRLYPTWSRRTLLAATAIFAFSPFTFGIVYTVNLEQFLLFGFVLYFFARAEKLPMVEVAAAILICFSKETGTPMLAATVALTVLCAFLLERDWSWRAFCKACNLRVNLPILCIGVLWLLDQRFFSWSETNVGATYTVEEAVQQVTTPGVFNSFCYHETYFDEKWMTANVLNFTWLFVLLIALGAVMALIHYRRERVTKERCELLVGSTAALAVAMAVGLLFVTFNHARYNLITGVLLYFPALEAIHRITRKDVVRTAIAGCAAALLLVQSYTTVDPLMYALLPSADKGAGRIVYTENSILARQGGDARYAPFVLNDNALYNREIYDMDLALDRAFAACEIDGDTCFVFSSELQTNFVGKNVDAEYILLGWGYSALKPSRICWDEAHGRRVLTGGPGTEMHFAFVGNETELDAVRATYGRVYYVQFPYYDAFLAESIAPRYPTALKTDTTYRGWRFCIYEIGD